MEKRDQKVCLFVFLFCFVCFFVSFVVVFLWVFLLFFFVFFFVFFFFCLFLFCFLFFCFVVFFILIKQKPNFSAGFSAQNATSKNIPDFNLNDLFANSNSKEKSPLPL